MAYEFRRITEEDEAKIRRDFEASPESAPVASKTRVVSAYRKGQEMAIDVGKNFYIFNVSAYSIMPMNLAYETYVIFFKGVACAVRIYEYTDRHLKKEFGISAKAGFSCFEKVTNVPPNSELEEFKLEFIEAYLGFLNGTGLGKICMTVPFFSNPFIAKNNVNQTI